MSLNRQYKINQDRLERIGIILFLIIFTFLFLLRSPLSIWQDADARTDSSVFKNVAFLMSKGYMPYRDTFDHKGPLIYLINFWGNSIAYYRGVWCIEYIAIFITLLFIYKISRLVSGRIISIIATLFSMSLLFFYFDGGNLTEEYAMPFLAVSIYIYSDYFMNCRITKFRLIACGFCFGAVCMLRPNMISVWVVFSIAVIILCIRKKQFSKLEHFIGWFVGGFCIIVLPVMIWLIVNNSFYAFIEDYINFNILYSSDEGGRASFGAKWKVFFYFINKIEIIVAVISCGYLWAFKDRFLYGVYAIYLFFTLFLICLSGQYYGHYGMILVPTVTYPFASFLGMVEKDLRNNKNPAFYLAIMYILATIILPNWLEHLGNVGSLYEDREGEHHSALVMDVCNIVTSNTNEQDRISVYGNWNIIYVLSQRISASKYSYQFPIGSVMPSIMDEYFEELKETQPKIIVVQLENVDERIINFLDENNYIEIWSDGAYIYELRE